MPYGFYMGSCKCFKSSARNSGRRLNIYISYYKSQYHSITEEVTYDWVLMGGKGLLGRGNSVCIGVGLTRPEEREAWLKLRGEARAEE